MIILSNFFLIFFSILRERLKTYKSDPYREVER